MKEKTEYQQFGLNQLLQILNENLILEKLKNEGINKVIERIVRWYRQITNDGKKDTYQQIKAYKRNFKVTTAAYKLLVLSNTHEQFSYEHTPAVSVIIKKIIEKVTVKEQLVINDLEKIFDKYEIIIMLKGQSNCINGSEKNHYEIGDNKIRGAGMKSKGSLHERLTHLNDTIHPDTSNNNLFK
jgi:hypothetical protein